MRAWLRASEMGDGLYIRKCWVDGGKDSAWEGNNPLSVRVKFGGRLESHKEGGRPYWFHFCHFFLSGPAFQCRSNRTDMHVVKVAQCL